MAGGIDVEDDLEQVARIEAQNRAAVGADVADFFQRSLDFCHGVEVRREDHVMDLARLAVLFIDAADFAAQQEAHGRMAGRRRRLLHRGRQIVFQTKKPVFGWLQAGAHLLQPARMGNIAAANDMHAFELRPTGELFQRQVFAGRAGKVRMDV